MSKAVHKFIRIQNATTHNLKGISLEIPHHQFVVITGISGSGKSSLAFDIIAKEGQRRYFETLPSFARQFQGKINPANVDFIHGLSPVITVEQKTTGVNTRSTVGTMTDLYSLLRLLFARTGESTSPHQLTRSLFSFNTDKGKCMRCNGLGKEEQIDLEKLIIYPEKSIREGALAPTLPTGYIMYSQVTIDVLNQVCEAEGFNVDIPWNKLTTAQQQIILFGSEKIKVPFGKHSLESRLKWTGIKAKPREEGFYKGMISIMSDILRRDRNPNILKYVSAVTCQGCNGKRLNDIALSVTVKDKTIADLLALSLVELYTWINAHNWCEIARPIIEKISIQIDLLTVIGLEYLTLNQPAKRLSGSESQRIRVVNQIGTNLSNVLYVFDEPSIGLSTTENKTMLALLKNLVAKGNSVIVVEHDLETIHAADWIIDIGPKAGSEGGQLLFNGPLTDFKKQSNLKELSPTLRYLSQPQKQAVQKTTKTHAQQILLTGCNEGKLDKVDATFFLGKMNVVTGKSGSGKANLVKDTLKTLILNHLKEEKTEVMISNYQNINQIDRLVFADQSPIGRTPRSNPATYLGLADHIRDLFAKIPEAKEKKFTKSRFSFNNKGGRCETCQGAGRTQIGMHFLGKIELICAKCNGKRFNAETLAIMYQSHSIAEVYGLTVNQALQLFSEEKKISNGLKTLQKIGLGYLTLGQSSTTLSGGEAQRIKLANELQKKAAGHTLYILNEPSIGLHPYDVNNLLHLFDEIKANGDTLVCIEQDAQLIAAADHIIDLGTKNTTVPALLKTAPFDPKEIISLTGVQTHLLKNIDVQFPKNQLSVVTGLSGSGKSSLVYDTLYAEANSRFTESLSTFSRSFIKGQNPAQLIAATGLTPTVALQRKKGQNSPRSTVATVTGIHDHLRLLYARIGQLEGKEFTAQQFSFNHALGACEQCGGVGYEKKCDPTQIIIAPEKSIWDGALTANKAAGYFTNLNGQFIATLHEISRQKKWDLSLPWTKLSAEIQTIVLYGTGDQLWEFEWEFKNKTRSGKQQLAIKWDGFCNYINAEFELRKTNKKTETLLELLEDVACNSCKGARLKAPQLSIAFNNKNIAALCALTITDCLAFLKTDLNSDSKELKGICSLIIPPVIRQLETILALGLGHLSLDRLTRTLSGGELQRIHLAGQLSKQLFGVTYVLDEPTIGLDEGQISVLLDMLRKLIKKGNTVVIIEHDKNLIQAADYIVELGPKSGTAGGELIYQGSLQELKKGTLTYDLLHETEKFIVTNPTTSTTPFGVKKASKNNLKNIDVTFQSNRINAITGVSCSGKSTLVKEVIFNSFSQKRAMGCTALFGNEQFEQVVLIDQQPITLNALSSPSSYLTILTQLQGLFGKTATTKAKGLKRGDFSYQSKGGKCLNCNGYGQTKTPMDFMSDIWITCDTCFGKRYNDVIANCFIDLGNKRYAIGDLLDFTITDLLELQLDKKLNRSLQNLIDLGIGHLKLGQAGNTLSGGEAQRLKLAKALQGQQNSTLYLFDEPSTGLHLRDLEKLIAIFNQLISEGHTVLFIEHNSELIKVAHHKITLGPEGGELGGNIISNK